MRERSRLLIMTLVGLTGGLEGCGPSNRAPVDVAIAGVKNVRQDGRFYTSGNPTPEALGAFRQRGVGAVIDLRKADSIDLAHAEAVRSRRMKYVHLPMSSASMTNAQAKAFLEAMRQYDKDPVLIQCGSGNRAGGMYGLYYQWKTGCSVDQAMKRARQAGLRSPGLASDVRAYLTEHSAR